MRGGFLPPAMLCVALALALTVAASRAALQAAVLLVLVAFATWWLAPLSDRIEIVFIGCWASVVLTAALIYLPWKLPDAAAWLAAANVGFWAGSVSAIAGTLRDLAFAIPCLLLIVVARPIVARGWSIALKVVASWLIAIATLVAMLPLTPTPGYLPDHMD